MEYEERLGHLGENSNGLWPEPDILLALRYEANTWNTFIFYFLSCRTQDGGDRRVPPTRPYRGSPTGFDKNVNPKTSSERSWPEGEERSQKSIFMINTVSDSNIIGQGTRVRYCWARRNIKSLTSPSLRLLNSLMFKHPENFITSVRIKYLKNLNS